MDRWVGKVAIVTGSGAGIGAAIAKELVNAGVTVVGLDKRLEKLEKLSTSLKEAEGKFYVLKCDVRKEEELLDAFKWVNSKLGGIDILVNNAGIISNSKIIDDDPEAFRDILQVNVLAVAISIRQAVASMKSRDVPGYIININSVCGHSVPISSNGQIDLSLYPSSKFAITALTETVRKELAADSNNKIRITSINPGTVKTEIIEVISPSIAEEYYRVTPYLDPKDIADAVLYVLGTRDKVQVAELTIRPANETV